MLGVVTGLKSEAQLLRGLDVMCISTGGRAHIARAKIERMLDRGVRGLISFGIAGALSPELKTGDLVIADKVASDSGEIWQAHQPWIEALLWSAAQPLSNGRQDDVPHHAAARRAEGHSIASPLWTGGSGEPPPDCHPGLEPGRMVTSSRTDGPMGPGSRRFAAVRDDIGRNVRVGALLGLDCLLSSPVDKADAFARSGAIAIDMESHHVAHAAAERGLPFVAVRAISDEADEALPAAMANFIDMEGRTKMSAVLAALILGRVSLGELLQAGRASRRAHQALLRCRGALAGLG